MMLANQLLCFCQTEPDIEWAPAPTLIGKRPAIKPFLSLIMKFSKVRVAKMLLCGGCVCCLAHEMSEGVRAGAPEARAEQDSAPATPLPAARPGQVSPSTPSPSTPAKLPKKTSVARIRISTRLVHASVVVEDKHGNPIVGLKKEDFLVFDDKRPQKIADFSVTTNQPQKVPAPALPPDTFTNRLPGSGDVPPNVTVILLDGLNTSFTDQAYARQQVIKFLMQIQPQDRLALYVLGSKLRVLHDFTSDATALLAELRKYAGHVSPALDASEPTREDSREDFDVGPSIREGLSEDPLTDLLTQHFKTPIPNEVDYFRRDRAQRTLEALLQIVYHVHGLPGRKTLVWVSGSFPLIPTYMFYGINSAEQPLVFGDEAESAAKALSNSSMVVYPVDAHGLTTTRPDYSNFVTMKVLAEHTGGRAFYNTNDLRGAIRNAIDDSRTTYELDYYPDSGIWDGRFHPINVKVKRNGARVRTRQGYLALSEPDITPEVRKALISQAVTNLVEDDRLALTVRINGTKVDEQGKRMVEANIRMDPRDLNLKQQDGLWAGRVNLFCIQLNAEKKVVDSAEQPYLLNLLPATYARAAQDGFTLAREIAVHQDAVELRVVLREPGTSLAGAVAVPLEKFFPTGPSITKTK
jgi:VWFA-related protein